MPRNGAAAVAARIGNLTDHVTSVLTKRVIGHRLSPGKRLGSEAEIAEQFGVSRTVVREAVSRLKSEGLIVSKQGVGAIVANYHTGRPMRIVLNGTNLPKDLLYLMELRIPFEIEAAAIAALRRSTRDLATIHDALARMEFAVINGTDAAEADVEFHRAIVGATRNPHFVSFMTLMEPFIHRSISLIPGIRAKVQMEHMRIFEAIRTKNPKAAAAAASAHVRNTAKRLATLAPSLAASLRKS